MRASLFERTGIFQSVVQGGAGEHQIEFPVAQHTQAAGAGGNAADGDRGGARPLQGQLNCRRGKIQKSDIGALGGQPESKIRRAAAVVEDSLAAQRLGFERAHGGAVQETAFVERLGGVVQTGFQDLAIDA